MTSELERAKELEQFLKKNSLELVTTIQRISNWEKLPHDWNNRIKRELGKATKYLKNYKGWKEEEVDEIAYKAIKLIKENNWIFQEVEIDQEPIKVYCRRIAKLVNVVDRTVTARTIDRYFKDYNNYLNGIGIVRPIALTAIKFIEEEENFDDMWENEIP